MTPAARLAAAAEVLDQVAASRAPADGVLRAWGRAHRFAGSKDRRAVAERVYAVLRARPRLAWRMGAESGRALVLASLAEDGVALSEIETLFSGQGHAPAPLTEAERARLASDPGRPPQHVAAGVPAFVADSFRVVFGDDWFEEARALTGARAPVDLRVNVASSSVEAARAELAAAGLAAEPTPWSAWGLRLGEAPAVDVQGLEVFAAGRVEVQDEGSQLAALLAGAEPGMTVVDYCAGGGGKTLALAAAMAGGPAGTLVACDVSDKRLEAVRTRLARAGAAAELRPISELGEGTQDLAGRADLVLVDAPCSGSGTWRRHPEAAWRLTPEAVEQFHHLQVRILASAARLVRPGGRLAYVTCSLLARENEDSAAAFEAAHPQFRPRPVADALQAPGFTAAARERLAALSAGGHRLRLSPRSTATDGFFIALYERLA